MFKFISFTLTLKLALLCVFFPRFSLAQQLVFTPEMSQATIQNRIDSRGKSKKLVFSPGVYTKIASLTINPARVASVRARGAKFQFPADQKKFTRYFNIIWSGQSDSPPLTFDGGAFDMNEENQSRVSYNKEHQAALFADATSDGKLLLTIRDVSIRDSAGDGISIYRNTQVAIKNVTLHECFRGGLTVSAGGNEVTVNDLDARGHRFRTGLRFEPSGMASRQIPSKYLLQSIRANYLNFQLGAGSTLTMSNSIIEAISPRAGSEGYQGYIFNEGGQLLFEKCQFYSNRPLNFRLTGDSTIRDSEFKMCRYNETDNPSSLIAITLRWYNKSAGKFNDNQKFVLSDCDFSSYNLGEASPPPYAVRTFETHPYGGENNQIRIEHTRIADDKPWGSLYLLAGKASKTKLILQDNQHGEAKLDAP